MIGSPDVRLAERLCVSTVRSERSHEKLLSGIFNAVVFCGICWLLFFKYDSSELLSCYLYKFGMEIFHDVNNYDFVTLLQLILSRSNSITMLCLLVPALCRLSGIK